MSWFAGANPLDELVEKATDSGLPSDSEDLALNLEICDRIRSKAVTGKDAMRSLKKRISNQNPNVQLLALNLCDLCVKNGGSHFLVEVASREFVDNLISLLKAPLGINPDVRHRLLELIQAWALAFESRSDLGYMMTTYQGLRNEGAQFPPEERLSAAFVDTAAPPDWADSDVCMRCRTAFTFRNRKHHCRNCGNVFCGQCSTQTMTLPQLGINEPVRVCDGCHAKRAQSSTLSQSAAQPRAATVPSYQKAVPPSSRSASDKEDLDLKRALELSLADSGRQEAQKSTQSHASHAQPAAPDEQEDSDFKAAVEASLRESAPKQATETYSYPSLGPSQSGSNKYHAYSTPAPSVSATTGANSHELSPAEQENIKLFSTLVERLKADPSGAILRDAQVQELYESISALRPKIARSLGDTVGKYELLVETHSKLATAVKYYDQMLEARLASTYDRGQTYQGGYEPEGRHGPYAPSHPQAYYEQAPTSGDGHHQDQNSDQAYYNAGQAPYHDSRGYNGGHRDDGYSQAGAYAEPTSAYAEQNGPQSHHQAQVKEEEVSLIDL